MEPIEFKEQTKVLGKPNSMTDEECVPLPVWNNGKTSISCWKATRAETLEFLRTGKIYIGVTAGESQPPIFLSTSNPFTEGDSNGN